MPSSLGPSFVEINYHSADGFHTMTLPTLEYDQGGDQFETWAAGTVDAVTMVEAFVDTLLPFFPTTVVFDNYTIYDLPTDPGPALPRKSAILTGKAGAVGAPGWTKAVQFTVTIRTTLFGILKIVQKMVWDGQEVRNIYHVDPNTGITPTVMATVTDLFWDWWDTSLQATLTSDLTLYEFEAIDMTTASSPSFPDIRTPAVGDNAQDSVPNNVALCVSWLTNFSTSAFSSGNGL